MAGGHQDTQPGSRDPLPSDQVYLTVILGGQQRGRYPLQVEMSTPSP